MPLRPSIHPSAHQAICRSIHQWKGGAWLSPRAPHMGSIRAERCKVALMCGIIRQYSGPITNFPFFRGRLRTCCQPLRHAQGTCQGRGRLLVAITEGDLSHRWPTCCVHPVGCVQDPKERSTVDLLHAHCTGLCALCNGCPCLI